MCLTSDNCPPQSCAKLSGATRKEPVAPGIRSAVPEDPAGGRQQEAGGCVSTTELSGATVVEGTAACAGAEYPVPMAMGTGCQRIFLSYCAFATQPTLPFPGSFNDLFYYC